MKVIMSKKERYGIFVLILISFCWIERAQLSDFILGFKSGYSDAATAHKKV